MKRLPLAIVVVAFVLALGWFVALRQAVLFLVGLGMGAVLAGARFGFTTGGRKLIEQLDPSGVLAQLLLLGLAARSEEHTSELQSLMRMSYAVFCLKKKKYRYSPGRMREALFIPLLLQCF